MEYEDKVPEVAKLLARNNITSVPVWQERTQTWVGLVDTLDLAATLASIVEAKLEALDDPVAHDISWDELELVQTQPVGDLCDIAEQNPWLPVSTEDSLVDVFHLMSKKSDIHRVPVVETVSGDVIGLLTQSRVLQFIYDNLEKVPTSIKNQTLSQWYTPKDTNFRAAVETVLVTEQTFKAFRCLSQKEITGVAVVNSKGILCGCLSASDLKRSAETDVLRDLYLPVGQYIAKQRPDQHTAVITCTLDETNQQVLAKLVQNKIHRIFLVSEDNKPTGVLSLCDIIAQFSAENEF